MDINTQDLLKSGDEQLTKLQQIVQQAIAVEKLIVENLLRQPKEVLTRDKAFPTRWQGLVVVGSLSFFSQLYFLFGFYLIHFYPKEMTSTLIPSS